MLWKKKMCAICKIGKKSYKLDPHSETCPYIWCWKNGKCQFFMPLDKTTKKCIFIKHHRSPRQKN